MPLFNLTSAAAVRLAGLFCLMGLALPTLQAAEFRHGLSLEALERAGAGTSRPTAAITQRPSAPTWAPPAVPADDAGEIRGEVQLRDGDSVEIVVFEDPEFTGVYKLRPGGVATLPQIGSLRLGGLTPSEAAAALKERLERDILRQATVSVFPTLAPPEPGTPEVVYVIGEIKNPGFLRIPPGETLTILTAIIRAGGLQEHADPSQVQLARLKDGRREISFMHFDAVLAGVEAGTELPLQHGDIVNVVGRDGVLLHKRPPPPRGTVYLSGQVKSPGPHPIQDTTVYQTILRRDGFARFANLKKVYLLRVDPETGLQARIPVNIHAVIKGARELDIPVQDGDIIVVPERFFSF